MHIAFYAPMKSPHHPRPSGDRRIARLLIKSLEQAGHSVELMSELRAWEGKGDPIRQQAIKTQAEQETRRILSDIQVRPPEQKPDLWFSYHLYHKAPDWIGPAVARQLKIPYLVAEASYAPRQEHGDWKYGLQQVRRALDQASAIICLNSRDRPALETLGEVKNKLHALSPFVDTGELDSDPGETRRGATAREYGLDPALPWLISVAMMRNDAKLLSYRLLAQTLARLENAFQLILVGDGKARSAVERLFTDAFPHPVCFTGQLEHREALRLMQASDLFAWPAVNEAIGMAILEAQACGLPVVAGASGAIPDIVRDEASAFLCSAEDPPCMARYIDTLLADPRLRHQFSRAARENVMHRHSLEAAAHSLNRVLTHCNV